MPNEVTKLENPPLSGSVFINNTSYSGADIKVVINIYDGGKALKARIDELKLDLFRAQDDFNLVQSQISEDNTLVSSGKPGTPEFTLAHNRLSRSIDRSITLSDAVANLQARIAHLEQSMPTVSTKVLAEAQTLSVSIHREKMAVRAFGHVYPKGFTRGQRQIAGSMIFTVFNEHVLYEFLEAHASDFDAVEFTSALLDQLPPVDISVSLANEFGSISRMTITGVEFVDEGQVMSIEDILTESTVTWVARDIDPLRSVSRRKLDENSIITSNFIQSKRASDLLLEENYLDLKETLSPWSRFSRRRNPFL